MDAALKKRGFEDNSEQLMLKYTAEQQGGGMSVSALPLFFPVSKKGLKTGSGRELSLGFKLLF